MNKMILHKSPDKAVLLKYKKLKQIRKTKGDAAYIELLRTVILTDPWYFLRVVLDMGYLDEHIVGVELLSFLFNNWGQDLLVCLPRGHGKTAPMSGLIAQQMLVNPDSAILQVTASGTMASNFNRVVSSYLQDNEIIQQCFGTKYNPENGFVPSTASDAKLWGEKGLQFVNRKPRLDPNLICTSIESAFTGRHPDFIFVDDLIYPTTNNPKGYQVAAASMKELSMLLPANGFFLWTGTRWGDADPIGMALSHQLMGRKGHFKSLIRSCYIDDNPELGAYYPKKKRWNMTVESGEDLAVLRERERSQGMFFSAQMRNDPKPKEFQDIKVDNIVIYEPKDRPKLNMIFDIGLETTGGGYPLYAGFNEYLENMNLPIYVQEIKSPRSLKEDRIMSIVQPIVNRGDLYAQYWMIGDDAAIDNLGYELRRLGVATHDDIADALHNAIILTKGIVPERGVPATVCIAVDLAWTEKKKSDYSIALAVALDDEGRYYVLDYIRFQCSAPTGIYEKILAFYNKISKLCESDSGSSTLRISKQPNLWK